MPTVRLDLRHALRSLRREPALVAGLVLTFGLAIGPTATMVGLVTRLMLAPPPGILAPEHVARAHLRLTLSDGESFITSTTSYPTYTRLRGTTSVFSSVAATSPDTVLVGRSPALTRVAMLAATGDFFTTLRATPAFGRFFGPGDDELPAGNSVVVLGHAYWKRAFAGDRSVLGRELVIEDEPFTIVGVAAADFNGDGVSPVDAYLPLSAAMRHRNSDWATNRRLNLVSIVVRLRDGVSAGVAGERASAALRDEGASVEQSRGPEVELESIVPGKAARETAQSQIAIWLTAVSLIVLLIATANVGTLLSLRAARRRRDVAIRIAMGARRGDLARGVLIETMGLALVGSAAGALFARWFSQLMRVMLLPDVAGTERLIDTRTALTSVCVATVAGLVASLAPLSHAARMSVADELRAGGGHASGRLAFQNTLVSIQVALCTLLLVGAALFVRSLQKVQSQDLGFSTAKLLYVTLDFRDQVSGAESDLAYYEAVDRARRVPGVTGATVVAGIPFGPHNIPPVSVPNVAWPPTGQIPIMYGATPEYLELMDVTLLAGRLITKLDRRGAPLVVLVNESLARTAWPNVSPLGKCLRAGFAAGVEPTGDVNPAEGTPCRVVVGVVRDSRARSLRPEQNEDRLMQYYVPFEQLPDAPVPDQPRVMGMMVRVADLDRIAPVVQLAIQSSSVRRLFARTRPYQDLIDPQLRSWRFGATLFTALGTLALVIAAVGLFGVVSYVVTQRTRELGVRLALGATARTVGMLVVRDAVRLAAVGIGIGVAFALAGGPVIGSLLFRTSPRDLLSLAVAAAVLVASTVLAAALPAWRAGRVNPIIALRADG